MFRFSRIRHFSTILGIETSCDDTAVAIINYKREILAAEKFTNRNAQQKLGGICPKICAEQHHEYLPILMKKCYEKANVKPEELTAIAVTTKPGLVIALKEGISISIQLAKNLKIPLIPVHHMKAHALSVFLSESKNQIKFPFVTFLISGGHALIGVVKSVDNFELYGKSVSGSPGECMDKVAREINEIIELQKKEEHLHPGALVEMLAKQSNPLGHSRYSSPLPSTCGADMNFSQLKSTHLNLVRKAKKESDFSANDFCASLQHSVACHISTKLHSFFEWYQRENEDGEKCQQLVVGGGVASNQYILNGIKKIANSYKVETFQLPSNLCTDNAEMIALTGLLMLEENSPNIIKASEIPETIYAHAKCDIGLDLRWKLPKKPKNRLAVSSLFGNNPIKFHNYASKKEK